MRRRSFFSLLGGATAWVATAPAQEPRRTIGLLGSASSGAFPGVEAAVIQGLKGSGFIEGKNISIERRWAEGQYDRLPSLASELVRRGVAVIVCIDAPAAFAAKAASSNIPIAFAIGTDPVKIGLVDRFSRPGGNITGVYNLVTGLASKHLELLHELLPAARTIALFVNPNNPNHVYVPEALAAANALGLHLEVLTAGAEGDLEAAFKIMAQQRADALVMIADPLFIAWRKQFVALAARWATPAIYPIRWFADVGGLMSYGADTDEQNRQAHHRLLARNFDGLLKTLLWEKKRETGCTSDQTVSAGMLPLDPSDDPGVVSPFGVSKRAELLVFMIVVVIF